MSLINLIKNIDSSLKTRLLGNETTKILKYTFTKSDGEAVSPAIINQAVAAYKGSKLVFNDQLRADLIEYIKVSDLVSLGFKDHDEAILFYKSNINRFISDFSIESIYKIDSSVENRTNFEYTIPKYGENNGTNAFPHPYQLRLKDQVLHHFLNNQHSKTLTTMPTGAGKTVLAMEVVIDLFRTYRVNSKDVLKIGWFVDSKELCEQSLKSFQKLWKQKGDRKVMAQRYFSPFKNLDNRSENQITFASFSLLSARRTDNDLKAFLSDLDLVIIDEAHGSNAQTYAEVIDDYKKLNKDGKILGLTATPFRNDDDEYQTLKGMFNTYLELTNSKNNTVTSPIEYLVNKKYLAKINFQVLNATRGDSQSEYYNDLHDIVKSECQKIISNKKNSIIFAESLSHAIALNIFLKNNNIENELIVGETPNTKRKEYLDRFGDEKDSLSILINFDILATGIDVPGLNSIMILRNIQSAIIALQILGRAMRGKLNGGNEENTIFLTKDNQNRLIEYRVLEDQVLNN